MSKTIIKSALIIAAILLTGTNAQAFQAKLPAGTKFQLQTGEVGSQIAGLSPDGKFFAIICNSGKDSADLLLQNSDGDIVVERYNSTTPSVSAWAPNRSSYVTFTDDDAKQVCANPNGSYGLQITADNKVAIQSFKPETRPASAMKPGPGNLQVRTGQIGKKVVAVTDDAKFFVIACNMGYFSSSADLIYPNDAGNIVVKEYNVDHIRNSPPASQRARYWPMTAQAMSKVCNFPNGIYTLSVAQADQQETKVDFVSGESFEANLQFGKGKGRGF